MSAPRRSPARDAAAARVRAAIAAAGAERLARLDDARRALLEARAAGRTLRALAAEAGVSAQCLQYRERMALRALAQEPPAPPLSPADTLDGAEEMLRRIAASAGLYLDATEAGAIVAELDRLRARLDAEDAATLIAHGRQAERAAIVSWLSAQQYGLTAASVERGEHLARKEAQP